MRRASAKPHTAQATLKEMVAVLRALEQILADLRQGKSYQITRLTRLKRLCAESEAATQFAAFVAQRSLQRLVERKRPETVAPERWERDCARALWGSVERLIRIGSRLNVGNAIVPGIFLHPAKLKSSKDLPILAAQKGCFHVANL